MPNLDLIQASFGAGVLSPSLYPRVDLDKFRSGLKTARNFIIHTQGGASNRCGLQYIASAKNSSSMCVTTEFIFNQEQAYVLEFGHLYVRFYTDGNRIENDGTPYEVTTPYLVGDLLQLKFEASADVIWITHPNYKTRTLTRYGNANWVLDECEPEDGPFMPENTSDSISLYLSAVSGTSVTLTVASDYTIDSNYKLLLHMNGVNGSTDFIDDTGKTVTVGGSMSISTASSKFGGSSGYFDGANDYLSIADSDDFSFGSGPFTIDFWINPTTVSGQSDVIAQFVDSNNYWRIEFPTNLATMTFVWVSSGVTQASYTFTSGLTAGTWSHLEFVRNGSNFLVFLNGVSLSLSVGTAISTTTLGNIAAPLVIGSRDGTLLYYNGYLDEVTIRKGIAANTSNFTPPTSEYSITSVINPGFLFSPLHVDALFKLSHYVEGQTMSASFTSATTSSTVKCFTTWRLITHGTWTGKFHIQKSTDGGTTWTVLRSFSSVNDFNADTSGTEDIELNEVPFLLRINMYSYTSGTANIDLTADPFFQDGIVRVTSFTSTTQVVTEVLQSAGSTSRTTLWSEGSWSDYRGWPSVARFFQDRLCFAATNTEPQTIWMTKTSNYYSFRRSQTLLDTDGITINLPSRQVNQINNMIAFKQLLAFTSSAIWSIGPISGTALTPTSVKQDIEEYSGSSEISPAVIGTEAIYVQNDGETIRNIGFQLQVDGFTGSDANILANHLFQGYTISKMAYQRNPNSVVWCLRSDGKLLSFTYNNEQQIVAWALHDTDGTIESICVIPGDNGDELWCAVSRDNGRFIERMIGRKQFSLTGHVFLDSYLEKTNTTSVVSGFTHLASQVVSMIADGVVLDQKTVSGSGTFALSSNYTTLYAGLPYDADLETLNIEIQSRQGTAQGSKIKVGNVTFRLVNTRGGYIGPNFDTLYEAFEYDELNRANQLALGTTLGATSNFNGDIRVPLGAEYSNGGRVCYRQSDPLPVSIGCVVPEVDVGGKSS